MSENVTPPTPDQVRAALVYVEKPEGVARCAACGLPAHRYGRNEGMGRFDPQACINSLLAVIDDLTPAARDWLRIQEAETIWWCEEHRSNGATNLHCFRDLLTDQPFVCRIVERRLI